jgi:Spy/CpxP family protein refolding chaperone
MKKLSLIAALALGGLLACSTIATAQDASAKKGGKGRQTVEQRLEAMSTQLSLTDEQKPKVKAVLEETEKKMKDVPREERQTKMPEIMAEQSKKLKEILTPDQQEKYKKMQEARKAGGKKKKTE